MTNCSKNCPDYTVDCERFDCCECDYNPERIAYEQGYEDGAIAELEKIKDRLEIAMWYNHRDKEYCLELIGKRISKLKGSE